MTMKRLLYIAIALCTLCSCNNDEEELTKQKDSIVSYLTSSRRMVAEEDIDNVLQENPPFYTAFGQNVFRHITNYYALDRNEWSEVEAGDVVDISFNAYTFSGSEPNLSSVYWSNIPATISAVEAANNHPYDNLIWSEEPLIIPLGKGAVLKGLEEALVGCRDQDSVQIYMTSEAAYGKHVLGTVPKNSSVAWYIKILNVTK